MEDQSALENNLLGALNQFIYMHTFLSRLMIKLLCIFVNCIRFADPADPDPSTRTSGSKLRALIQASVLGCTVLGLT